MAITLLYYQAEKNTNTAINGGKMTVLQCNDSGSFPPSPPSEQLSGVTRYRKVFAKIEDDSNRLMTTTRFFLKQPTSSNDTRLLMLAGTQRDTYATLGARYYGTGILNTTITPSDTVLIVDFETGSAAKNVVQAGDLIAVIDSTHEVINKEVDSIIWTGEQAAITLTTPIGDNFADTVSYVGSMIAVDSVQAGVDNIVKSFSALTFDNSFSADSYGAIEQSITLTFTGANAFTVVSDSGLTLPGGSTLTDYAPINPTFSKPYFTIPASGWGGTGTLGDSMSFDVHPCAVPLWIEYKVNASSGYGVDSLPIEARIEY